MIRKRLIVALMTGAMAAVAMGGISFWRPFASELAPTARTWCQVVAVDGNARVLLLLGPSERSNPDARSLADAKLFWRRHLFVALPFRVKLYDRDTSADSRFGAHEARVDISFFLFAGLLLLTAWLLGPGLRYLAHIPGVWREIRRPSGGGFLSPGRRLIRRGVIAVHGFVVLAAAVTLLVSVWDPILWQPRVAGGRIEEFFIVGGTIGIVITDDPNSSLPGFDTHVPGFRLKTQSSFQMAGPLTPDQQKQLAAGTMRPSAFSRSRAHEITLDIWLPIVLFCLYPIFALIRGPLRRHVRKLKGQCLQCGYNLTGLIEPRCPECGSPFGADLLTSFPEDLQVPAAGSGMPGSLRVSSPPLCEKGSAPIG